MKVEIEVSIGELYDKITILRIKKERITDADKLHNITETLEKWLKVGDAVFLIFNADKEKQKWYYRSLTEMYFLRGLFFENKSLLKMGRSINKVLGKMGM